MGNLPSGSAAILRLTAFQTISTMITFALAMIVYPDVQRKAQEELDRVVGRDRLPEFEDQPSLPYITAIQREVMRCGSIPDQPV